MLFQTPVSVGDLLKMAFQCAPDAQTVLFLHLFYCPVVLWDEERKLHTQEMQETLLATEQLGLVLQTART